MAIKIEDSFRLQEDIGHRGEYNDPRGEDSYRFGVGVVQ